MIEFQGWIAPHEMGQVLYVTVTRPVNTYFKLFAKKYCQLSSQSPENLVSCFLLTAKSKKLCKKTLVLILIDILSIPR